MTEPTATASQAEEAPPAKPRGIHPGWVLVGFFAILMAFNISFIVIAVQHPPELVPKTTPSETVPAHSAFPGAVPEVPSR